MHMKTHQRAFASAVAAAVASTVIGVSAPASAAPTGQRTSVSAVAAAQGDRISVEELARHLEEVKADRLIDANGQFDHAAAEAEFGRAFADNFQKEWDANAARATGGKQRVAARAAAGDSYATCLLKGVGLGGLGGATAAIVDKLKDKKWADAASLITKEAAKRGVKIGVKGGVAGLAAALGAFAVWCATPWA